jgi:hypothetical protein
MSTILSCIFTLIVFEYEFELSLSPFQIISLIFSSILMWLSWIFILFDFKLIVHLRESSTFIDSVYLSLYSFHVEVISEFFCVIFLFSFSQWFSFYFISLLSVRGYVSVFHYSSFRFFLSLYSIILHFAHFDVSLLLSLFLLWKLVEWNPLINFSEVR